MLRPLYQKLNRRVYSDQLSDAEKNTFSLWEAAIAEFTPRIALPRPRMPRWLIYMDAASAQAHLCALLFKGDTAAIRLEKAVLSPGCGRAALSFPRTNLIYGVELSALVLFFEDWAPLLKGSRCWVYLDNNCLAASVCGDSNAEIIAALVARFGQLSHRYDICFCSLGPIQRSTQLIFLPGRGLPHSGMGFTMPPDRQKQYTLFAEPSWRPSQKRPIRQVGGSDYPVSPLRRTR